MQKGNIFLISAFSILNSEMALNLRKAAPSDYPPHNFEGVIFANE
jgi:hypothetical protein